MQTDDEQEKTLAKNRHQYIKTDITEKQNWIRQNNPRQRQDLPSDSWKAKEYLNVYKQIAIVIVFCVSWYLWPSSQSIIINVLVEIVSSHEFRKRSLYLIKIWFCKREDISNKMFKSSEKQQIDVVMNSSMTNLWLGELYL